ncbi:MAG TPA: phosphoglucosamine mutase [Pirellulales bacterium]|nr:phosphoglucosamine mutase [Pirellulales bacterium]
MREPIISVSGLRGIVGESLSPEIAMRYATAWAALAPQGDVVLTRDGRASGPMLADAIRNALVVCGRSVIDAGVAATPTTGVLIRHFEAAGGIQISASHNPPQYNGMKLFSPEGRVISAAAGAHVISRYHSGQVDSVGQPGLGRVRTCDDSTTAHLDSVCRLVEVDRIRRHRFRVVLDANHGAGSLLGRRLLEHLGCQVTLLGEPPDGQFEHPPEPTAENLAGVLKQIPDAKAAVGFCQDPDADRLAIIDEQGMWLGEEYTLALCVDHVLRERRGPIVTNCSTSRMSEDLAARYGVPFFRSAVGEANVTEAMWLHRAVFGGEGNGGPIDPRVGLVRDSFVGMALVLAAMAGRDMQVSQLAAELPRYEIVKTRIELPSEKVSPALAALEGRYPEATKDRLDGLRLDWPGKWLLVRASNTEPIVRAIAEAPTAAEAQKLCDEAASVMTKA